MTLTDDQAKQLRAPFDPSEIGKLPKSTCKDCSQRSCTRHQKRECRECGGYHSTATIHLDYAGHAEVTDRLLDVDPNWDWQPMAVDQAGLPVLDRNGGMWIRLTIHGTSRLGYGDAPGKQAGNAVKEVIGDAIRNAAMRFGVGLDLWRKTEKHEADQARNDPDPADPPPPPARDWRGELERLEAGRDLAGIERLGREAGAVGASTVIAQAKAAWHRVNTPPPPNEEPAEAAPAEGEAAADPPLPRGGQAAGSAPATRRVGPAGDGDMHQNVRDEVTDWAAKHGLPTTVDADASPPPPAPEPPKWTPQQNRDRAAWRKTCDRNIAGGTENAIEAGIAHARKNGWVDLAEYGAKALQEIRDDRAAMAAEGVGA